MFRILLDPTADGGGGGSTTTTTPEPPKPDPALLAAQAQLAATNKRLAELEEAERKRAADAKAADEAKLVQKGEYEKLLAARNTDVENERKRAADAEARSRTFARDSALAQELAKHPVLKGKAPHLVKLWKDDFEAVPDGDGYRIQTRDLRPLAQVVAERLAHEDYDNFVEPSNQGGGGGSRGTTSTPTQKTPEQQKPKTLLEAAKERLQGQKINGFGLRPVRRSG